MTQETHRTAVLFDWDGVIVDSSAFHERSWELLAAEAGYPLFEGHFKISFGMKSAQIIANVLRWTQDEAEIARLSLRKEELYRELLARDGIKALPGVDEFLTRLRSVGVRCAVGSSTSRRNIDTILGMLGWEGRFDAIACGDDVKRGKPAPDVFLTAASRVGVPPPRCVVVEDAHVGIEAARAAGMKVVAVTTSHARETLLEADLVVERLDVLQPRELIALLDASPGPVATDDQGRVARDS